MSGGRHPRIGRAWSGGGALAVRQSKITAVNTASTNNTVTWDSAAVAGNALIIIVAADDYVGSPPSGFTEPAWGQIESYAGVYFWYKVAAGGETSAQYTLGSSATSVWATLEIEETNSTPLDVGNSQFTTTGGNGYTTPAVVPTTGARIAIAAIGGTHTGTGIPLAANWTNDFTEILDLGTQSASATEDYLSVAYKLVTGDGATAVDTGCDTSVETLQMRFGIMAVFK